MAFLSDEALKGRLRPAKGGSHPLLQMEGVTDSDTMLHFQGCVLATLVDDGEMSPAEKAKLDEIASALSLTREMYDDCLKLKDRLKTGEDKGDFCSELVGEIGARREWAELFMDDFESVVLAGGVVNADASAALANFGAELLGREEWRARARHNEWNRICNDRCFGVLGKVRRMWKSSKESRAGKGFVAYMHNTNLARHGVFSVGKFAKDVTHLVSRIRQGWKEC